jgi:hypothetical protein
LRLRGQPHRAVFTAGFVAVEKEPPRDAAAPSCPWLSFVPGFGVSIALFAALLVPITVVEVVELVALFFALVTLVAFAAFLVAAAVSLAAAAAQVHVRLLNGRDVARGHQEDISAAVMDAHEFVVDADYHAADHALVVGEDPDGLIQQAPELFAQIEFH